MPKQLISVEKKGDRYIGVYLQRIQGSGKVESSKALISKGTYDLFKKGLK